MHSQAALDCFPAPMLLPGPEPISFDLAGDDLHFCRPYGVSALRRIDGVL